MLHIGRFLPAVLAGLLLAGCGTFFGKAEAPPLPGERISVLRLNQELTPDPSLSDTRVQLPQPYANADWPQAGGVSSHTMYHLALPDRLSTAWRADVGAAANSDRRLLSGPVIADGRIYAMDAESVVSAFDARDGHRLWRVDLTPEDEDTLFGGGLAVADGRLYVTTPYALLFALDSATGKEVWHASMPGPMHAAPAVSGGRVFAITIDNQTVALAADDGRRLWTHTGVSEAAGLLGGATPAVVGNVVVAPYTSGEIFALRAETGRVLWNDSLAGVSRGDALSSLTDISGRPVIDRDLVFAISHSGTLAAIDLRTGGRAWDSNIGGVQMPWVAGDYLYVLSNNGELVCLTRRDGRVRWVQSLPPFEDMEARTDPIYWAGPLLAGDRLILSGSSGEALSVSPYTGEVLGRIELPARSHLPPIVAGGTLYFLSDNAELIALR